MIDFLDCKAKNMFYTNKSALLFSIVDKNKFPIYKNIARWQSEERTLLANYLKVLLA